MANKIHTNHTLAEYKKKYGSNKDLKKIHKADTISDKYLLNGKSWWLIDDTYYEIPSNKVKVWWSNLGKGGQIAICALLGVGVATAVVVPTVIAINNKQSTPDIKVIGADIDKNASSISINKDSTVAFTYADNKDFVKINYVKVGDKEISDSDYTLIDGNSQSRKIVIKAKAMTSVKVEISVELKDKVKEINKEKFVYLANKYVNSFLNSYSIYPNDKITNITIGTKTIQQVSEGNVTYKLAQIEDRRQFGIYSSDDYEWFYFAGKEFLGDSLASYLEDNGVYKFNEDSSIEYSNTSATSGKIKQIKMNKFGYIEHYEVEGDSSKTLKATYEGVPKETTKEKFIAEIDKRYYNEGGFYKVNTKYKIADIKIEGYSGEIESIWYAGSGEDRVLLLKDVGSYVYSLLAGSSFIDDMIRSKLRDEGENNAIYTFGENLNYKCDEEATEQTHYHEISINKYGYCTKIHHASFNVNPVTITYPNEGPQL